MLCVASRGKNAEVSELSELESMSLVMKNGRLKRFGHVKHKERKKGGEERERGMFLGCCGKYSTFLMRLSMMTMTDETRPEEDLVKWEQMKYCTE